MLDLAYPKLLTLSVWNGAKNSAGQYITGDWQKAKAKGIVGAIIRAGSCQQVDGKCYEDFSWKAHVQGCLDAGLPFGLYWYFRPNWSYAGQAGKFMQVYSQAHAMMMASNLRFKIKMYCNNEISGGCSPEVAAGNIKEFLNILDVAEADKGVCTGSSWINDVARKDYWKLYELFFMRWNLNITSPWADGKFKLLDWWPAWKLWQYSGDEGEKIPIAPYGFYTDPVNQDPDAELIYFNGNLEAYELWFGLTVQEEEDPELSEIKASITELDIKIDGVKDGLCKVIAWVEAWGK